MTTTTGNEINSQVGIVVIPGLNTPATSDCHTLRILSQKLADSLPSSAHQFAVEYDKVTAQMVVDWVEKNAINVLIVLAHSFGGATLKWLIDQFAATDSCHVQLAIFFDPAPNGPLFHQFFSWEAARTHNESRWSLSFTACDSAICFYQHNQVYLEIVGICGVPFRIPPDTDPDSSKLLNVDCTPWGLDHNGVPESEITHRLTEGAFKELMKKHDVPYNELAVV